MGQDHTDCPACDGPHDRDRHRKRTMAMDDMLAAVVRLWGHVRPWWWLSFVSSDTEEFIGVAIVEGYTAIGAMERAWRIAVNPGGHVMSMGPFRLEDDDCPVEREHCDRLLSRQQLEEYGIA